MQNLLNDMTESVSKALGASQVTFDVLTGELDVPVVYNGLNVPTLATRVRDYVNAAVSDGELDGEDGVSIDTIFIEESTGELFVRLSSQTSAVSLGKIVPDDGVGVAGATYDDVTGELSFDLEDGTTVPVGNIRGTDGQTVRDAYVSGTNLFIRTRNADGTDNPPINAGDISRFGGISANDIEIKENGDLTVIFSDGTTRDLGRVVGRDGVRGPSVQSAWLNQNGQLQFLRSDGTQFATNPINVNILDGSGNTIEDVQYDDVTGMLSIKLSADTEYTEIGVIKGKDGRDGKDGVQGHSVENVTIQDGTLLVKLSHEDGPNEAGQVVFYESGDNSLSLTQARVIDDVADPNHKMLEIHLTINGEEQTQLLGPVIGDNGIDGMIFESAYINVNNELVLVQDSGTEMVAGVIPQGRIGAIDINVDGYIDVYADEAKTDKLFTIGGSPVKGRDGINGFGITSISKSGDGKQIIFETTDPDTSDVQTYTLDMQVPYETRAIETTDGYLTIRMSDGTEFDRLVKLHGDDGEYITNVVMDSGQLRITTNTNAYAFDVDYRRPSSIDILEDGRMEVHFSDNSPSIITNGRVSALDGDGITSMVLEDDNSLTIGYTTDNRTNSETLSIPSVRGTGVYDVDLSRASPLDDAIFSFKTTDGGEYNIAIPSGVDGYSIEDIIFDTSTGNLRIIHTNPSIENSTEITSGSFAGYYELVITDVKGTTIESVLPATDTAGDDVVRISLSNNTEVDLPILKGRDAAGIVNITYDETRNRLEIETTFDAPDNLIIVDDFVGRDGDRIISIEPVLDDVTGSVISIEMVKYDGQTRAEETITLDVIRGKDGVGLDTSRDDGGLTVNNDSFALEMTTNDGITHSWPQVKGADATLTLTDITARTNVDGAPEIVFTDSDGNVHLFEQQKGIDANEALRDIMFDGQDLVIDHITDGMRGEFRVTDFRGVDGTTIEDISIDSTTGSLSITVSDRVEPLVFEQLKGVDGKSITGISFVDEALVITTNLDVTPELSVPMVRGVDGITIEDITIVDNKLVINVSDRETPIEFEQMRGTDGDTITDVRFDEQNLIIEHSLDTSPTIIPLIKGKDGVTIENMVFDEINAELQISLSDRVDPIVFPQVKGRDGDGITSIEYSDTDELVINTTIPDAPEIRIPLAAGVSGDRIDNVELINDGVESYINVHVASQETPIRLDITKGIDGKTILDIQMTDTNDLIIASDFEGYESIVIPAVKGTDGHGVVATTFDSETRVLSVVYTDDTLNKDMSIPLPEDGDTIVRMDRHDTLPDTLHVTTVKGEEYLIGGVFGVDGKDGMNIASFEVDVPTIGDLTIVMDDTLDDQGVAKEPTKHVLVGYAKKVESISIDDASGSLAIKYVGIDTPFLTPTSVMGRDGNGRGINSLSFVDGVLSAVFETSEGVDTEPTILGDVSMVNVVSADIDPVTGMLSFTMDDTTVREVGIVFGRDGRYVESIRIDDVLDGDGFITERNLVMIMSNGDEVAAGNIKGEAGRSILPIADPADPLSESGIEVLSNGDLIVRYSNGDAEPVGNIGGGMGLTVWSPDEMYEMDRVVIHDGGMYMSRMVDNVDEPPSENWSPLALGDQITEIRKPVITSPLEGETAFSMLPRLEATEYAPIVSSDERDYREFQVTSATDTTFTTPLYTFTEDADNHDVRNDLLHGELHLWRCRDRSMRGSLSAWSDVVQFEVPPGRIEKPSLSIDSAENINETFNAPRFIGTAFENLFNAETHVESDWHILRVTGIDDTTGDEITEEIYFGSSDTVNLEEYIIPFDLLNVSSTYKIRVKYRASTIESLWSDWVEFTTEATFEYIATPAIAYDGSATEVRVYNPVFKLSQYEKTPEFSAVSTGISMPHTSSDWEVRLLSTNALVESNVDDTVNLREYAIQAALSNDTRYLVRGRFFNERFGYSAWSEWLEFRTRQEISQPIIDFQDDTIMAGDPIADGTVLVTSDFMAINETHVSTDWLFLNIEDGDSEVFTSVNDTTNLTTFTINHSDFPATGNGLSLKVLARFNGQDISSEYSPQTFIIFIDI